MFSSLDLFAAPVQWQMGFQAPATEIMESIIRSHNFVMFVMSGVVVVVFSIMIYVLIRFRKKPEDKIIFNTKNSHNVVLEILWTLIPLIIVGFLTISNVKLIRQEQKIPKVEMTLKAIGYQWYWGYVYPDYKNFTFDSYMKTTDNLEAQDLRLLEVDNRVVVPINTNILLQVTSADVIHSWTVPALGVKIDAVPGRLNEAWFNIKTPGVYYGQCSELCGRLHGFMPIVIVAVEKEQFDEWIQKKTLEL
ncbi:cytochrome c oxidase, subunit II [Ehrlichia chaffeensis str. Liberty]|nr:cytochrome c oxidase, subunit II [Ehrlichia chaffeensis str. Jax]AHX06238.1 cytochrome c oxidase, subunit II [Ehrlichia chaffeensis str. Liberty]AHX07629.1 cytochrome c oxidase, subunit II [Ehrlichia chaffeensis str. Osceola]AHX09077.1 cytochrome c oxidase, subunit II [Ehrlichia chaffeensis str. Wakulla]AHX10232.1 cytochrome c oxidase, subunit II [Ehrlichia chaffeensis str. West Paces]